VVVLLLTVCCQMSAAAAVGQRSWSAEQGCGFLLQLQVMAWLLLLLLV
jgi:hypothetical protein